MKSILFLILSCLSVFAQTYPLKTDNSSQLFSGGATNIASLTNANTFTGTNALPALITTIGGLQPLITFGTNTWVSTIANTTNFNTGVTNGTDLSNVTRIATFSLPGLGNASSVIKCKCETFHTNAQAATYYLDVYAEQGGTTNYVGSVNIDQGTTSANTGGNPAEGVVFYCLSLTNQFQGNGFTGVVSHNTVKQFVTNSAYPFRVIAAAHGASGGSNAHFSIQFFAN